MAEQPPRSRAARDAAERALVRVVHHYGATPEFVLLGGLVPTLLCSTSGVLHAGTTDVDVQVNLEIAAGAVNAVRLERALVNAEFEPEQGNVWRWRTMSDAQRTVVEFELLADLENERAHSIVSFRDCDVLGAINLRGTGFATRDYARQPLESRVGGVLYEVEVNVSGLAGFLLSKAAAAHMRRKEKDWYDIAFVLRHNDAGGPVQAAAITREHFGPDLTGEIATALDDLLANFATPSAQGPSAYSSQMGADYPDADQTELRTDAVLAVQAFHAGLFS
jgi:hypothetical protein